MTGSMHDPLCVYRALPYEATCFGCLLVELRSDAIYADDPEVREQARENLRGLAEMAQAHLLDAMGQDGLEVGA